MAKDLRTRVAERVAERTGAPTDGAGRAPATLADQVQQWQEEFQLAMPTGAEARQLVRDALHLMRTTKHLSECTAESVLGGLMTFAQLGLRPGVLGHGWLVPFRKSRKVGGGEWTDYYLAQIVIGYKGYVELTHRSPLVEGMIGRAVHQRDEFDLEYGSAERVVHRPYRGTEGRGPVVGYYAVIRYHDSSVPLFWHMTRDEAVEWRDQFAMSVRRDRQGRPVLGADGQVQGSGPWFDMDNGPDGASGFDQMAIKTCFLRAQRWAPKGTDMTLTRATEVDGAVRVRADPADPDEMLTAEHPVPLTADGTTDSLPPGASHAGAPVPAAPDPTEMQTDFPAVVGQGTDAPPVRSQQARIHALLGEAGVSDDATRWAVLGRIAGRQEPLGSATDMTRREAAQVQQHLEAWQEAGTLAAQVSAVAASSAPAATPDAAALPAPGTSAWHDDGHPTSPGEGRVARVPVLLNGDCGICEQPAAGASR